MYHLQQLTHNLLLTDGVKGASQPTRIKGEDLVQALGNLEARNVEGSKKQATKLA